MTRLLAVVIVGLLSAGAAGAQQNAYVIGAQDVLNVSVYDQPELTGKFSVEADGSVTFPLVGRLQVGGLTLRNAEDLLRQKLADGYLKNPQVSLSMDEYKSQRVFVMGEVRAPGAYQLTGDMTVIEVLARAGGTTQGAADEIQIVRPREGGNGGPVSPDKDKDVEIIRVDLRQLQSGALSQNVTLRDSDTIIVARAQAVYVFGQVKSPGAYPIERDTTVLQALSLAGGVTDRGSTGRIKIVRTVDGKKKEIKVKLTDVVEPGDTVIVAERFF